MTSAPEGKDAPQCGQRPNCPRNGSSGIPPSSGCTPVLRWPNLLFGRIDQHLDTRWYLAALEALHPLPVGEVHLEPMPPAVQEQPEPPQVTALALSVSELPGDVVPVGVGPPLELGVHGRLLAVRECLCKRVD